MLRRICALLLLAGVGLAGPASGAILRDDTTNDISGDRLAPTDLFPGVGINTVLFATQPGDLEYLTISLPDHLILERIVLVEYVGDSVSFIGVQSGDTFTVSPGSAQASDLLGWTHFGFGAPVDLLPQMGLAPLSGGNYTFWLQEFGEIVTYRLDFEVAAVPEPGTWLLLAGGLFALAGLRGRRSRPGSAANR